MDVSEAFSAQATCVEATALTITTDDWPKVGLGEWTVAELFAHLIRAADRITAYADLPVDGDQPSCDRASYLDFGLQGEALRQMAAAVADRSRQDAARIGHAGLVPLFRTSWRQTATLLASSPGDRLIHTIRGPMALEEFAATRVVELVVHHTDLCRALGKECTDDPAAVAMTEEILGRLVDGGPIDGLSGMPFILAATGRDPHPDPRLPVLQ